MKTQTNILADLEITELEKEEILEGILLEDTYDKAYYYLLNRDLIPYRVVTGSLDPYEFILNYLTEEIENATI